MNADEGRNENRNTFVKKVDSINADEIVIMHAKNPKYCAEVQFRAT